MGFRRTKADASQARCWNRFLREAQAALASAGIPSEVYESKRRFDVFLLHGSDDLADFHLPNHGSLEPGPLHSALVEVCRQYLLSGLPDPGITILGPDDLACLVTESESSTKS